MKLVNLTDQTIILIADSTARTIEPSGKVCYIEEQSYDDGDWEFDGMNVPITAKMFGRIINEPEPEDNTGYIVDAKVAIHMLTRGDIFILAREVYSTDERVFGYDGLISLG